MVKIILSSLALILLFPVPGYAIGLPGATETIVNEEFNTDASNWTTTNGYQGNWQVVNGALEGTVVYSNPSRPSYAKLNDLSLPDKYEIRAKIKGIQGVDKFFLFNYNELNETYAINIRSNYNTGGDNIEITKNTPAKNESLILLDYDSSPNITYDLTIVREIDVFTIYINNVEIFEFKDENPIDGYSIGLLAWPGAYAGFNSRTTVQYDDIQVLVEDDGIINDVPLFAQDDEKWATESYGHVEGMTIESDGCVMTVWAMLLSYYGVDQIEATDSAELVDINPKTLNAWLLDKKSGYLNGGLTNHRPILDWIDEYRDEYDSGIPELDYIGMDYNNLPATQSATLNTHLSDDEPTMIRVWNDGHAVLAIGKNESTYIINDPLWNTYGYNNINNNRYNNIISSLRRLNNVSNDNVVQITPLRISTNSLSVNNTDKSEIILVYPDSTKILITDSYGGELGFDSTSQTTIQTIEDASYVFHPDNNNPNLPPTGEDHVELAIKNPSVQNYTIEILQTEKENQIQIVTYSSNGEPFSSYLPNSNSLYSLTYDPTTGTSTVEEIPTYTTYQDLIELIKTLRQNGHFNKPKTSIIWIQSIEFAERMENKGRNNVAQITINRLQKSVSNLTPKHLDQAGSVQLLAALEEFKQNHFE